MVRVQVFGNEFDPKRNVVVVEARSSLPHVEQGASSFAVDTTAGQASQVAFRSQEDFFLHVRHPNTPRLTGDSFPNQAHPLKVQHDDQARVVAGGPQLQEHAMHSAGLLILDPVQPDNNPGAACFRIGQVRAGLFDVPLLRC